MQEHKYCNGCDKIKPIEEYGVDNSEKDGHRFQCKICRNAKQREYARNNKELIKLRNASKSDSRKAYYKSPIGIASSRRAHLKRQFGLSLEDYNKMSEEQYHKCFICSLKEMNNKNKVLCVDHNHDTQEIRGLLCGMCNTGLGCFRDNIDLLNNAIKYLKNYEKTN